MRGWVGLTLTLTLTLIFHALRQRNTDCSACPLWQWLGLETGLNIYDLRLRLSLHIACLVCAVMFYGITIDTLIGFCLLSNDLTLLSVLCNIRSYAYVLYSWLYGKFVLNENKHFNWLRHAYQRNNTSTPHRRRRDGSYFHYLFHSRRCSVVLEFVWC